MKNVSAGVRVVLVYWLYLVAGVHLLGACFITWYPDPPWLAVYHQQLLMGLGFTPEDNLAMEFQLWWLQIFGATLQAFSIFLLILVDCAHRQRRSLLWGLIALTLLWWVPQDISISLQKGIWSHVWVDVAAIVVLVPPLFLLAMIDRHIYAGEPKGVKPS